MNIKIKEKIFEKILESTTIDFINYLKEIADDNGYQFNGNYDTIKKEYKNILFSLDLDYEDFFDTMVFDSIVVFDSRNKPFTGYIHPINLEFPDWINEDDLISSMIDKEIFIKD